MPGKPWICNHQGLWRALIIRLQKTWPTFAQKGGEWVRNIQAGAIPHPALKITKKNKNHFCIYIYMINLPRRCILVLQPVAMAINSTSIATISHLLAPEVTQEQRLWCVCPRWGKVFLNVQRAARRQHRLLEVLGDVREGTGPNAVLRHELHALRRLANRQLQRWLLRKAMWFWKGAAHKSKGQLFWLESYKWSVGCFMSG